MCSEEKFSLREIDIIKKMSTEDLLKKTKNLEFLNRVSEARIIAGIGEISKRKAHIDLGYSSLFDYVTKEKDKKRSSQTCGLSM
ncbi:MAG: hypothetical protein HQK54_05015 [Oligoflexales bacterium]|nr:hypothetical protein [Oligoflexales bacterium]